MQLHTKQARQAQRRPGAALAYWKRSWQLYLLLLPVVVYYAVFHFGAYPGLIMAFQHYRIADGILGSQWAGLENFRTIFHSSEFYKILRNTLFLNLLNLVMYFPAPILLALLLNEVRVGWFKRLSQSLMYLPHFFSWVVLGGMIIDILSPGRGVVNNILDKLIGEKIFFMASKFWWPLVFVLSSMWKEVGWGSIIYLAAISGIGPELYEAATVDGAGRFRQMWHITLPGIRNTIVIMLILRMGGVLDVGMEQILMLENAAVKDISDVISTYTYRVGIQNMQYSTTTAIGIFQSLINMTLLICANWLSKKFTESSIF